MEDEEIGHLFIPIQMEKYTLITCLGYFVNVQY